MAKRKAGTKKAKQATDGQNGGIVALTKELFQAAQRYSAPGRYPIMMRIQSCP
ncbi:MAG TPA: hypothetical protein VNO75_01410 [Gemmatimonadaceae bacterium]|nr:hypothetical protein [Gemmatimonadaceae bacterium]